MRNPHYYEAILDYAEKMTSPQSGILNALERETHLKMLSPQMVSGHHLGRFLAIVSKMVRPKVVFEFGTFTGYASFCLLEGLDAQGVLHTFEVNPETVWLFEKYRLMLDGENQIRQHLGDARSEVEKIGETPDLVWIDAGKRDNLNLFKKVIERMRPGGVIMVDNTLWSGKVLEKQRDGHTQAIHEFNVQLSRNENLETLFLPVRDGVTLSIIK